MDDATETLMVGTGDERGLHAVAVSRKPQVQPDRVVIAAAEAGVIRADDGETNRISVVPEHPTSM